MHLAVQLIKVLFAEASLEMVLVEGRLSKSHQAENQGEKAEVSQITRGGTVFSNKSYRVINTNLRLFGLN